MDKTKWLLLFFVCFLANANAQVKIGSAGNPNSNAVLELDGGTNKGLLLPRLSNTQITALSTAPDGMLVYSISDGFLYLRKSAAWQKISDATTAGGSTINLPFSGTTAAAGPALSITTTNNGGDAIRGFGNSGNGISAFSTSGAGAYFASGSGPAMITSNGPVGINTTEPAFPLDINGRTRIRSNGAFNSAGIWYDKMYTSGLSSFVGTLNDSSFGIYGTGDWKFAFDHVNNRLGINNSNPKASLSFSNATGNKLDIYYGSDNSRYGIGLQGGLMQLYTGTVNDDIAFGYGSSNAFTESMRIKGNGNVGIGIAPSEKLHVAGNVIITGDQQVGGLLKIAGGNPDAGDVLTAINLAGNAVWRIPNAGRYAFHVSFNAGSGPLSTLAFNTSNVNLDFNEDFVFNIPTQRFTAPADGLYQFNYCVFFGSFAPLANSGSYELILFKNGVPGDNLVGNFQAGQSVNGTLNGSTILRLNTNDQVSLSASSSSASVLYLATPAGNFFSGYRVK